MARPYISLVRCCLSKLPAALPQEQLGVSECGWSGQGGRERARQGEKGSERETERELARLSCFPKREEREGRTGERESE